jgi:broad specificity phosphatase PhoE
MTSDLVLVRHARVADRYRGICYGRSDVELGPEGLAESDRLAEILSGWPIRNLVTSGATRAGAIAERIAVRTGLELTVEPALLERDFGAWELRSWDSIYEEVGDAMHGLIHQPETYRPPGGETTAELRARAISWYARRPREGLVVAIGHGGPIAAIRGTLAGKEPVDWLDLIPRPGSWVRLTDEVDAMASEPGRSEIA